MSTSPRFKERTCINLVPPKNRDTIALISNFIYNLIAFILMAFVAEILIKRANKSQRRGVTRKTGWVNFIYRERPNRIYTAGPKPSTAHHHHDLRIENPYSPSASDFSIPSASLERRGSHKSSPKQQAAQLQAIIKNDIEMGKMTVGENESAAFYDHDIQTNVSEFDLIKLNPPQVDQVTSTGAIAKHLQSCLVFYDDSLKSESTSEKQIHVRRSSPAKKLPFLHLLSLSDELVRNRRGDDAVKYLHFLRQLILFLAILSCLCLFFVLPINLLGAKIPNRPENLFRRTTIQNISPGSFSFWCHVVVSSLIMPISVWIFQNYNTAFKFDSFTSSSRTLLIRDSTKSIAVRKNIVQYLSQFVSDPRRIEGVQLVYDCGDLFSFKDLFINYYKAWRYCRDYLIEYRESFEVRPYFFGQWLGLMGCCSRFPKTYGFTYYSKLKWYAARSLLKNYADTLNSPKASFFVTFSSADIADRMYRSLRANFFHRQANKLRLEWLISWKCPKRNVPKGMKPELWDVSYAANPSDIDWFALVSDTRLLWIREIFLNTILFVIFFFATTPFFLSPYLGIIPKILEGVGLNKTGNGTIIFSTWNYSLIEENIRSFCLLLVQQILPIVVTLFSSWVPHYLKSEQNFAIIWRVYSYLLCMILIIPSLGTSSIHESLRSFLNQEKFSWYCLFYVYDYSFFVVYVIQSAFIANGLRLLRISKIITYFFFMYIWAPGSPEFETARRQVSFEFVFGYEYPTLLFMVTLIAVYSIACPLIAPCGLVFVYCKYMVDRYNIYHAFSPTTITYKIHKRAVSIVYSSVFMMQFHIFAVVYTQHAPVEILGFGTCLVLISFFGLIFLIFTDSSPQYMSKLHVDILGKEQPNWCCCNYLPNLLALLGIAEMPTNTK